MAAGSRAKKIQLLLEAGWACQRCGKEVTLNGRGDSVTKPDTACLHHIVHKSSGGTSANDNLLVTCGECEPQYHDKLEAGEPLTLALREAHLA
jgi:hypothetical protein